MFEHLPDLHVGDVWFIETPMGPNSAAGLELYAVTILQLTENTVLVRWVDPKTCLDKTPLLECARYRTADVKWVEQVLKPEKLSVVK